MEYQQGTKAGPQGRIENGSHAIPVRIPTNAAGGFIPWQINKPQARKRLRYGRINVSIHGEFFYDRTPGHRLRVTHYFLRHAQPQYTRVLELIRLAEVTVKWQKIVNGYCL